MAQKAKFIVLTILCGLMLGFSLPSYAAQDYTPPVIQ
jgi:hypothetical protein